MQFWKLAIIQQYIFLMLLLLLSLVPDLAIAAPKTTLPQIRIALKKDDQLTNVNWTYQVSALWEKNSKGETEFFWAVKVDFPQSQSILRASVSTDPTGEVFQVKKIDTRRGRPASTPRVYFDPTGGITFKTSALNQTFTLETKEGSQLQVLLQLRIFRPIVIADNCEENFLKIIPKLVLNKKDLKQSKPGPSLPAYLAYRCDKKETGFILSVAIPSDVEWASNSLFETKGKGQSWKNFDLNPQTLTGKKNILGEFIFEFNKRRYSYSVIVDKSESVENLAKFRLSLGAASYSISKDSENDSSIKPVAYLAFEVQPFWPQLRIGASALVTIPINSGKYFVHTEASGYSGWAFNLEEVIVYEPRIYIYMAEGLSQNLNYFYKVSMPAIGGAMRFTLSSKSVLEGEVLFMQQKTSVLGSLRINWSNPLSVATKWGATAIFQKIDIIGVDLSKATSNQIYVGGHLDF